MYRVALFTALTLLSAAPAAGQSYDDIPAISRTVAYRDLDLSTPAGMQALERRVHDAARFVCRLPTHGGLLPFSYSRKCIDGAVRGAAPQVALVVQYVRRNQLRDSAIRVASH